MADTTTVVIHYKSPANDPLKVPRPHRIPAIRHVEIS